MENATGEQLDYLAKDEELKRFCVLYGATQSNLMYRLLSGKGDADKFDRIQEEIETIIIKSQRGAQKCDAGQVYDEARGVCSP